MTTDAPLLTPDLPTEVTTSTVGTRTTVHLLRHGEVHNPGGVLYGRLPSFRLSEDGQQMARDAAQALRGRDVTDLIARRLLPGQETAGASTERIGLDIGTDERLIESEKVCEGKTVGVGDGTSSSAANWKHMPNPFSPG